VTVDATVLFVVLYGYTGFAQSRLFESVFAIRDAFYDECAEAIRDHDGLPNKTMGDAITAISPFAMTAV
jgi:class 3 adenylate cyclase